MIKLLALGALVLIGAACLLLSHPAFASEQKQQPKQEQHAAPARQEEQRPATESRPAQEQPAQQQQEPRRVEEPAAPAQQAPTEEERGFGPGRGPSGPPGGGGFHPQPLPPRPPVDPGRGRNPDPGRNPIPVDPGHGRNPDPGRNPIPVDPGHGGHQPDPGKPPVDPGKGPGRGPVGPGPVGPGKGPGRPTNPSGPIVKRPGGPITGVHVGGKQPPVVFRGGTPHNPWAPIHRVPGQVEPFRNAHPYPGHWRPLPRYDYCGGYYWGGVLYVGPFADFFGWDTWGPTEWIYVYDTGMWWSPATGYVIAPPILLNDPITVAVSEQVPVLDPVFGTQEIDANGDPVFETVTVYYNAYFDPGYGAYGYLNSAGDYVWLQW